MMMSQSALRSRSRTRPTQASSAPSFGRQDDGQVHAEQLLGNETDAARVPERNRPVSDTAAHAACLQDVLQAASHHLDAACSGGYGASLCRLRRSRAMLLAISSESVIEPALLTCAQNRSPSSSIQFANSIRYVASCRRQICAFHQRFGEKSSSTTSPTLRNVPPCVRWSSRNRAATPRSERGPTDLVAARRAGFG
jgi:hypothetical protein